jgi:biotin transport system substrate-specific component
LKTLENHQGVVPVEKLRGAVLASLMAALTAVGAYLHVPVGPVPIVLATLFVLLAGLLLGSRWGLVSMGVYLLVGAIGMPVFSGGRGGLAQLFGPTGGYLFGYALSAWVTGFISERGRGLLVWEILAVLAGTLTIYGLGVPWLKVIAQLSWPKAFAWGILPFIPGDVIKASAALVLAHAVRPILNRSSRFVSV